MTDFKELYASKLMSAEEAAQRVEDGWLIGMDSGPSQTPAIISAMAARAYKDELRGVKVQALLDAYPLEYYADSALKGKITGQSWFSLGGARKAINGGWADYIPNYYRDIPSIVRERYDYDAVFVSVSPMDSHGWFSMGATSS